MKLNEKNVASFATCSSPIDKEGYLEKRGDFSKNFQRRWFVLKGNLLFYFEKKQDKEPLGLIVLEACSVQVSSQAKYAFEISFDGQGSRVYLMTADNDEDMQSWIKVISHASYEYMRSIVDELQRRVNLLTSSSKLEQEAAASGMSQLHVGPARKVAPQQQQKQRQFTSSGGAEKPSLSFANTKVENGILVDVSTGGALSPPPIPKKMKNHPRTLTEDHSHHETSPTPSSPLTKREPVQATPGAYSSPYTLPARLNPTRPLSPASTLDRTAVLQPTTLPNSPPPSDSDPRSSSSSNFPPPLISSSSDTTISSSPSSASNARGFELLGKTSSTVSASSARPKQVSAAPLDSNKSVFELHEDFTRALGALHNSKNS